MHTEKSWQDRHFPGKRRNQPSLRRSGRNYLRKDFTALQDHCYPPRFWRSLKQDWEALIQCQALSQFARPPPALTPDPPPARSCGNTRARFDRLRWGDDLRLPRHRRADGSSMITVYPGFVFHTDTGWSVGSRYFLFSASTLGIVKPLLA